MSNTDIVIRGLTTEEAQKLELISKRRGYQLQISFTARQWRKFYELKNHF